MDVALYCSVANELRDSHTTDDVRSRAARHKARGLGQPLYRPLPLRPWQVHNVLCFKAFRPPRATTRQLHATRPNDLVRVCACAAVTRTREGPPWRPLARRRGGGPPRRRHTHCDTCWTRAWACRRGDPAWSRDRHRLPSAHRATPTRRRRRRPTLPAETYTPRPHQEQGSHTAPCRQRGPKWVAWSALQASEAALGWVGPALEAHWACGEGITGHQLARRQEAHSAVALRRCELPRLGGRGREWRESVVAKVALVLRQQQCHLKAVRPPALVLLQQRQRQHQPVQLPPHQPGPRPAPAASECATNWKRRASRTPTSP